MEDNLTVTDSFLSQNQSQRVLLDASIDQHNSVRWSLDRDVFQQVTTEENANETAN